MKARIEVIEADHKGIYHLQGVCAPQSIFFPSSHINKVYTSDDLLFLLFVFKHTDLFN